MNRQLRPILLLLLALGLPWFHLPGGARQCLAQETGFTLDPGEKDGGQTGAGQPNTSVSGFPKDLWENFLAVFSARNVRPLLIGSAGTGIAALWDDEIHGYFQNRNHSTAFTEIGEFMGKVYVLTPAVGGLLVAGQFARPGQFRSFSYELAHGYVLTNAFAGALKVTTGRVRPDGENNRSFPSGHASNYFMIATVLERHYGVKAGIAGYAVAAGVAISRVAKDEHWASDVAAGATLGWIVGRTVSRRRDATGGITVYPVLIPRTRTLGVCLVLKRS